MGSAEINGGVLKIERSRRKLDWQIWKIFTIYLIREIGSKPRLDSVRTSNTSVWTVRNNLPWFFLAICLLEGPERAVMGSRSKNEL